MDELTLTSSLSLEEINENFENIDFFTGIMEGLEDVLVRKKRANTDDNTL